MTSAHSRHPPYDIANIISYQQRARLIECYPDRATHRLALSIDKAREYVLWCALRLTISEGDEDNLVAAAGITVPGPVLADKCPAVIFRPQRARLCRRRALATPCVNQAHSPA
jgi:hypothetical protein